MSVNRIDFLQKYWNYYVHLENDCLQLAQYIEFCSVNYNTCSNAIIAQLLNVGAEFDHFCKVVCGIAAYDRYPYPNISDYAAHLLNEIPDLKNVKVHLQGYPDDLYPFKNWNPKKASKLFWWKAYTNIKHDRTANYTMGNLYNLLNALAALYYLEMYYCKKIAEESTQENAIDVPVSASRLFRIVPWKTNYVIIGHNLYTDYENGSDNIL